MLVKEKRQKSHNNMSVKLLEEAKVSEGND